MPSPTDRSEALRAESLSLRTGGPADLDFLFGLLRDALGPYIIDTYGPWDEAEQRARFDASCDPAAHQIVELEGRPIGCLKVRRLEDRMQLDRVFLLPDWQQRGLGTRLVEQLIAEAGALGLPVALRVFKVNPAQRLYARLGFAVTDETETHVYMERPHVP